MSTVYIGIGSNIGEKVGNCNRAVECLERTGEIRITARSGFYRTCPVGGPPQEDYINGVLKADTSLSPGDLIGVLKNIEKDMGRSPAPLDHPRVIDLDILLYEKMVINTEELIIPHPRMHKRHFVLKGLEEVAADVVHPVLKKTVRELYGEQKT